MAVVSMPLIEVPSVGVKVCAPRVDGVMPWFEQLRLPTPSEPLSLGTLLSWARSQFVEIVLFGCEGHIVLGWCCWRLGRFEPEAQQMSLERPEAGPSCGLWPLPHSEHSRGPAAASSPRHFLPSLHLLSLYSSLPPVSSPPGPGLTGFFSGWCLDVLWWQRVFFDKIRVSRSVLFMEDSAPLTRHA